MIDLHTHLNLSNQYLTHNEVTIEDFINNYRIHRLNGSVTMINPSLRRLFCDCGGFVNFSSSDNHTLTVTCSSCNSILYRGRDPYHDDNVKLLNLTLPDDIKTYPFLCLSMTNATISSESSFFERHYKNSFCGWKFHPSLNNVCVEDINFNSKRPLIIHTSLREPARAIHAVNFAKKYSGNVLICHAASLDTDVIKGASCMDNVYFDICPIDVLMRKYGEENVRQFIDLIPREKLVYGSDFPWGDMNFEIAFLKEHIRKLGISEQQVEHNTIRYLGIENDKC